MAGTFPEMNQLGSETSPYLLQHRHNPVHWRPWGPAALAEARALDKPILLSVGYAACHWCHVMAHESFEDPEIAALMNGHFVNIKVDREERPDLDLVFQSALSMLGEQGGWPLTMFLTSSGEPFWGGTYFPPRQSYGRPAFADVLQQLAAVYQDQRDKVKKNVAALRSGLDKLATPEPGKGLTTTVINDVATSALRVVDPIRGGTAGAPKFPQPAFFRLIWRAYRRTGAVMFRDAVTLTLDALCQGGIYDHLGGGFARYATDTDWLVPHFEKMLYDNAQLVDLLTEVWLVEANPLYAQRIAESIDWLLAAMRIDNASTGTFAFASALDADSEGEEGRYYVWSQAEIEALLGDAAPLFCRAYGVTAAGNWEGQNILHRRRDEGADDPALATHCAACRARLLAQRSQRVPPLRDDKVLADWNGLMIDALARASVAFERPDWCAAAISVYRFIVETMQQDDRLLHTWCDGRAAHPAVLEDYANMARAALTLHEVTSDASFLAQARQWVATAERYYWDAAGGGYFVAASDTDDLLVRPKTIADHAVPSGNGVMVEVLARLFYLTGDGSYRDRAESVATLFSGDNQQYLLGVPGLLTAFEWLSQPVRQIVILGPLDDPQTLALRQAALATPQPLQVVQTLAFDVVLPAGHPATGKTSADGRPVAFVCVGQSCGLPVADPLALREAIRSIDASNGVAAWRT